MRACVFCGEALAPACCDRQAMSLAYDALRYHIDCDHEEAQTAIKALEERLK